MSPGRSPTGSLCRLPRPAAPSPEARGKGALSGHWEVGAAQGRPQQMPVPAAGPVGRGGACVRRPGGAQGPCGSGLNLGLVLPPGCPQHTPGSLGLATHSVISGAFSGRVFMTHSPIYPARVLVEPGQGLCWGLTMGEAPGLEQCLGTPRILPSQYPFPWGPLLCEHSSYEGDCAYCHFTDEETQAREVM